MDQHNPENLQPNDRIEFDVEGSNTKPFGYGLVTRLTPYGNPMILFDKPTNGVKIINIRKVTVTK